MNNRELKFRAWSKLNKKWLEPYPDGFHILGEITCFDHIMRQMNKLNPNIATLDMLQHIEIEQFTGIKDKTEKEIYSGDIFKLGAEKEIFEVRFEHGCFMAFCDGKQYGLIGELYICFIDVIGNIHENKNLLKG